MEDMLDQANEVQEALGRTYGMPEMDDADLDAGIYVHRVLTGALLVLFTLFGGVPSNFHFHDHLLL